MGEQSFTRKIWTVLLVMVGVGVPGRWAMSYCSGSFRFDRLCPDPRFGSRKAGSGVGSSDFGRVHAPPDTTINLNANNNYHMRGRGGGVSFAGSSSYPPAMSVKDPSTTSCNFYRSETDTAVVTAVHVTKSPWNFGQANPCNHIIKFNYDIMMDVGGVSGEMGGGRGSSGGRNGAEKQSVCQYKIGIQRPGTQDKDHQYQAGIDQMGKHNRDREDHENPYQGSYEEITKKTNVYFWHNFTLHTHSAEFVDTVTNYLMAKEDIACVTDKRDAQYAQIVVVVSKNGRCDIIVQQYVIDEKRSRHGCSDSAYTTPYPTPHPVQFCGLYDCSHSNNILTGLKLLRRRDGHTFEYSNPGLQNYNKELSAEKNPSQSYNHPHTYYKSTHDNDGGTHSSNNEDEAGNVGSGGQPCVTETIDTTPSSSKSYHPPSSGGDSSENGQEDSEPMEWMEMLFLSAFPVGGVVFILVVLAILRSKSAREICRGYSYPHPENLPPQQQQSHQQSIYQGSFNSIDKNTLPM